MAAWFNPPELAEAELKKRTLTNLHNARPTWLDLAHGSTESFGEALEPLAEVKKLDAAV
jgi:hypothetical protein